MFFLMPFGNVYRSRWRRLQQNSGSVWVGQVFFLGQLMHDQERKWLWRQLPIHLTSPTFVPRSLPTKPSTWHAMAISSWKGSQTSRRQWKTWKMLSLHLNRTTLFASRWMMLWWSKRLPLTSGWGNLISKQRWLHWSSRTMTSSTRRDWKGVPRQMVNQVKVALQNVFAFQVHPLLWTSSRPTIPRGLENTAKNISL